MSCSCTTLYNEHESYIRCMLGNVGVVVSALACGGISKQMRPPFRFISELLSNAVLNRPHVGSAEIEISWYITTDHSISRISCLEKMCVSYMDRFTVAEGT